MFELRACPVKGWSGAGTGMAKLAKPTGLNGRQDFLRIQRNGRKLRGRHVLLLVERGEDPKSARVGFTVSRRVGKAVARNAVRRRLREIVRTRPSMMWPGFDHVIVALPSARDVSARVLQEELSCLFRRARPRRPVKDSSSP
jgi:ribonuclease P protein component